MKRQHFKGHAERLAHNGVAFAAAAPPDMSIVKRVVAPAPQLDLTAFGPLQAWIEQSAECKSAPSDYVAMALLGAAAGCLGAARCVSPWNGWSEPAILFALIVGSPSSNKSPALDAVRGPLGGVEAELAKTWPETKRAYQTEKTAAEAHHMNWEIDVRKATKNGGQPRPMPVEAQVPAEPQMSRIVMTDTTIEAAATILSGNPRGLLLWRDEAGGWIANLGKYGGDDRAFWIEGYGGRPYVVDRKKLAEPLQIDHCAVSIVGGIQPDLVGSLIIPGSDDGFAARFLYCWPEPVLPTRPRSKPDSQLARQALARLRELEFPRDPDTGSPQSMTLPIDDTAVGVFQEWRLNHHRQSQGVTGLMASAYGKQPGQALRLALVLEYLWWATRPETQPEPKVISDVALGAALDLIEQYLKPMLVRVLGEATLPVADRNAAALAREIQRRNASTINARDVRRNWCLPGLREAQSVDAAIDILRDARWLTPTEGRQGGSPGRQRKDFVVDSRVHGGLVQ